MSERAAHQGTSSFKAALDRLTGGSLALCEYVLAVGTIAVLLMNMQTEASTLAAVAAAAIISVPCFCRSIHFGMEWQKQSKTKKDDS